MKKGSTRRWALPFLRLRGGRSFAPAGASALFVSDGLFSFNSERKEEKNATKTYGFGIPQRTIQREYPQLFPSRNWYILARCRINGLPLHSFPLPLPAATALPFCSTELQAKEY